MTQIDYHFLTLKEVIQRSGFIFTVEKIEPFANLEKVSILPSDSLFMGKNTPPYYEPDYWEGSSTPSKKRIIRLSFYDHPIS